MQAMTSYQVERADLSPIKTDRLPLVDQVIDVAKMFPSGCDDQIETLCLARHILSCYATPIMVLKGAEKCNQ